MALSREQLDQQNVSERHYETVTLPNGESLRGRTLLRGEVRRQQQFFRDNKGQFDKSKAEYIDDVAAAFRLVDDNGDLLISDPNEVLANNGTPGYFDNWSQPNIDAVIRLLRKLRDHEDKEPNSERRERLIAQLLDPDLGDVETLDLVTELRSTQDEETIEDAVKN